MNKQKHSQKSGDFDEIDVDNSNGSKGENWQNPSEESLDGNPVGSQDYHSVEESPVDYLYVDTNKDDGVGEAELTNVTGEAYADYIVVGSDDDGVMDQIDDYTDDEEILDDFADRQRLHSGSDKLLETLREHNSQSPQISGGDIDAAWDSSRVSGEESVGGSAPTPDQDVVDEIGEALGITYDDNEPLATADKLEKRDSDRWELNPNSAMSLDELEPEGEGDEDEPDELDEDLLEELDEDLEDEEEDMDDDLLSELEDDSELDELDEEELEDELEELADLDLDDDLYEDLEDDLWDDEEDD